MEATLTKSAVDAIVDDIVKILPNELLDTYRSPPGRKPAPGLLSISSTVQEVGSDKALALIKDVVDSTVFSMLCLIDADFKDKSIRTTLVASSDQNEASELRLVEEYRYRVDPGGVVVGGL